jgi:hypothetical protein
MVRKVLSGNCHFRLRCLVRGTVKFANHTSLIPIERD